MTEVHPRDETRPRLAPLPSGKRRIEAEDLFRINIVSDPRVSPDGASVAYVVTGMDQAADDYLAALWLAPLDGGEPRQLTPGTARDTDPRWSPDGSRLVFVSNRPPLTPPSADDENAGGSGKPGKPKTQLWLLDLASGETTQLTALPLGASAPAWSPDGATIAFLATSELSDRDGVEIPAPVADERIIDSIRYRHDGRGFVANKRKHIWTIPAAGGEPLQLTFGDVDDDQLAWSPDSATIAFRSNRSEGRELNNWSAMYTVPAAGGEVRPLAESDSRFDSPVWFPDGRAVAMFGYEGGNESGKINRIAVVPAAGGAVEYKTAHLDTEFGDDALSDVFVGSDQRPAIDETGRALYSLAFARGSTNIVRLDLKAGTISPVTSGERRVAAFSRGADGRFVYLSGASDRPSELFVANADGSGERQLTNHNQAWLAEVELSPAEHFSFRSPEDGTTLDGWLLKPPGFDSTTRYPAIVQMHGGPHLMYGHAIYHEMQLMVARGYLVLFSNPRGSSGMGEKTVLVNRTRWGETEMPDIMAAVDWLTGQDFVDPERLGITGGSFGGYMTNWIVGHTNRFRAAVTQRCLSNMHSFYGTSDIGFDFGEVEFGGTPWSNAALLLHHSPISYVDQISTPLLIIHNEGDLRCPIEQAEQLFVALKRLGKTTSFVRIPEEDHSLSRTGKPGRRLARLHHILDWFDRYL